MGGYRAMQLPVMLAVCFLLTTLGAASGNKLSEYLRQIMDYYQDDALKSGLKPTEQDPTKVAGDSSQYKPVCYYTNWSQNSPWDGKYTFNDIDDKLCTHIIYAFGKLVDNQLQISESNDEKMYMKLQSLKVYNPDLKTLIAVGGRAAASFEFTKMVESSSNRQQFIQSSLNFLDKHGFDGLDIDWEYPTQRGGREQDKENFVYLLKEAKEQFSSRGYLLTAAVSPIKRIIDASYDVRELASYNGATPAQEWHEERREKEEEEGNTEAETEAEAEAEADTEGEGEAEGEGGAEAGTEAEPDTEGEGKGDEEGEAEGEGGAEAETEAETETEGEGEGDGEEEAGAEGEGGA